MKIIVQRNREHVMSLMPREKKTLTDFFINKANATFEIEGLKSAGCVFGDARLVTEKYKNYSELKWWLKSKFLINTDLAGVKEAAELIEKNSPRPKAWKIDVLQPPALDVAKEVAAIKNDCAHAAVIDTIYVQLDIDQNKHQPSTVPIGTREIHGEEFGTYATKAWHELNTMRHMADWAKDQDMQEGQKIEHGQSKRVQIGTVGPCCFEGFVRLLGGTKYVSFHCYPNNR